MKATKLKDLIKVTDATFMAAQSKLAELREREASLRAQLEQLASSQTALAQSDRSASDAALKAGADALWIQWIAGRKTILNGELAQLQAHKANQFVIVKKAFGRRQAMRAIANKAKLEAMQARERRNNY